MLLRLSKLLRKKRSVCNKFWLKVFMLTAGVVGLDAAFAVETNYAIPLLLKAGLQERYASIVWAFSPLLGIFFQGYLGSASDRCRCSWGRRRPFILGLAICVCVSLLVFPYGNTVATSLSLSKDSEKKVFIFLYAMVGFGLMDFCLDQFDAPTRMYLLDSVTVEQSGRANFIHTAMSALGVGLGALIGAVNWSQWSITSTSGKSGGELESFDYQVRFVFGIVALLFAVCATMTLCSFSEKKLKPGDISYPNTPAMASTLPAIASVEHHASRDNAMRYLSASVDARTDKMERLQNKVEYKVNIEAEIKQVIDSSCCPTTSLQLEHSVSIREESTPKSSQKYLPTPSDRKLSENLDCGVFQSIKISFRGTFEFVCCISPHTLVLWVMSLFDWIAYLSLTIFISDYVGIVVYHGSPDQSSSEHMSALYDRGVRMTSQCRAVVCIFDIAYVLALEHFSDRLNHRLLLIWGHIVHVGALLLLLAVPSITTVFLAFMSTGIVSTHLVSIPYTLIHSYKERNILLRKTWPHRSDTKGKAVSLFSTGMFAAQLLLALFMGFLIDLWGSPVVTVVTCLIATILGGFAASRVMITVD